MMDRAVIVGGGAWPLRGGFLALALLVASCGTSGGGGSFTPLNEAPDVDYNFGGGAADVAGGATPTDDAVGGDAGAADAGTADTGSSDAGTADTGSTDAATTDTGTTDAGTTDAGTTDAGTTDAGTTDAGTTDAGTIDAGPSCGDGVCNGGETCQDCPADCGACPASCGDSVCGDGEDCLSCPGDCGACPASCGNKKCEPALGESCKGCPTDCGVCPATCGNGKCDGGAGESCQVCPSDCGSCPAFCGDGACNGADTCTTCPLDCGVCPGGCGDGTCNGNETCTSCSADCGVCPGSCSPLTSDGCTAAQQCYPVTTGNPLCGNPGSKAKGATCSGATDCAKGMLCVGKICKKICDATGANAQLGCSSGKCNEVNWGDGKPIGWNLGACFEATSCNLVTDVGCQADQSCDFLQDGKTCFATGSKTVGAGCTNLDECVKGTMCIGNPAQCLQKCNTAAPSCPSGKSCLKVTIDNNGTAAPDNLGVCN